MSLSSNRIVAPAGRRAVETKTQAQLTVRSYTFQKDQGEVFSVVGYDTPQEELMLGLAWEFYTRALDFGPGSLGRSTTNHFEMYARFFADDRAYKVKRVLPGLYVFLCEAPIIFENKNAFWPNGHPDDPGVNLRRCTFNMDLLAKNVRWYVDADLRFWNTLEFRIGDAGADLAKPLRNNYLSWLERHGLEKGPGYLQTPVSTFDDAARNSKHPFFAVGKKAGRLDPSLWQDNAVNSLSVVLANRASPTKRGLDADVTSPNDMQVDKSVEELDALAAEALRKRLLSSPVQVSPNQPINAPASDASQSMQLVPVAGTRVLLRTMPVPQFGVNQGSAPRLASVFTNSIRIKDLESSSGQVYSFTTPSGVSNTGDNIISIISNQTAQEKNVGPRQVIVTILKVDANVPAIEVCDYRDRNQAKVTSTLLVSARPSDCCVSWDGRRIAITDKREDGSHWVHTIDLVPDEKAPTMLKTKQAAASIGEPVLACTSSFLATSEELHTGELANPTSTRLKALPEQGPALVSVSTNEWMQPNQLISELNEARKHTVFVHLYERKDGTYLARVTPLNEDGTQADVDKTLFINLKLPDGAPRRDINDTTKPRVLWYPVPFYAADAPDELASTTIDTTKDQAIVVWCIHKDYAVLTTAPLQQDDANYVTALRLVSNYAPNPILNDLSLRVFDSNFNRLKILDFTDPS